MSVFTSLYKSCVYSLHSCQKLFKAKRLFRFVRVSRSIYEIESTLWQKMLIQNFALPTDKQAEHCFISFVKSPLREASHIDFVNKKRHMDVEGGGGGGTCGASR